MNPLRLHRIGWRGGAAVAMFAVATACFASGAATSARPELASADLLTQAYYALGLFVVGGLDIGTPQGGTLVARSLLWLVYFGGPLLFASVVFEAVVRLIAPELWYLQRLRGHFVVVGVDDLTMSWLRVLRSMHPRVPVVVVAEAITPIREQELEQTFGVRVVHGDITHDYLLEALRLHRARRVALLGDDNFRAFEAASRVLDLHADLGARMVVHCNSLRFLRDMSATDVAQQCTTFNAYNLAAEGLVKDILLGQFQRTEGRDLVVLAGFGRFGQSVLEALQRSASGELHTVVIMDMDAERRVQVADEQGQIGSSTGRLVLEGNISHPGIWGELREVADLAAGHPTLILGTGDPEVNLRTAVWLRKRYPHALIHVRTDDVSHFADRLGAEHAIQSFSITRLVEDHLPRAWIG